MFTKTVICVRYRNDGGFHIFTSEDVDGLLVANQNLAIAFADVAYSIKSLLWLNYNKDSIATPQGPLTSLELVDGAFFHWILS